MLLEKRAQGKRLVCRPRDRWVNNIVMCLVEYQNYRMAIPKELGKSVSAETDTKLLAAVTNL
jgi:hypothetical protein